MSGDKLAEAIERVRDIERCGFEHAPQEDRDALLAVCEAAARCAEAEARALQWEASWHPVCQDTGIVSIAGACPEHGGDACLVTPQKFTELEQIRAERDEARETLAGIERLLRTGWHERLRVLLVGGVSEKPHALADAVRAAVAERQEAAAAAERAIRAAFAARRK